MKNLNEINKKKNTKSLLLDANNTRCSQAVPHLSTNRARRCLISVIGREPMYSAWYGRWRKPYHKIIYNIKYFNINNKYSML